MKTQTQFKNASLVSVVNGSIVVKNSTGRAHTFTNASVVSVNNGTIIIESEWKPKRGELVKISTTDNGIRYAIFKEILGSKFWMYCSSFDKLTCLPLDYNMHKWYGMCSISNISPVTPEEQKEFDDFCKSKGKIWNKETLQWEKYRWKPKQGEKYFTIVVGGSNSRVSQYVWEFDNIDTHVYETGNCFKTRKEAEDKLEQIKKLLLEV